MYLGSNADDRNDGLEDGDDGKVQSTMGGEANKQVTETSVGPGIVQSTANKPDEKAEVEAWQHALFQA